MEAEPFRFVLSKLWPESVSELYRPSDRGFSAKLVPTFADIESHVVSVTVLYGRILDFLDRSRCFFLPDSSSVVLTRLSGLRSRAIASQRRESNQDFWICSQELWPLDHRVAKDLKLQVMKLMNTILCFQ
jgi:hypothetical protein